MFDSQGRIINSQIFSCNHQQQQPAVSSPCVFEHISVSHSLKIYRPTDLNIKQAAGVSVWGVCVWHSRWLCVCVFVHGVIPCFCQTLASALSDPPAVFALNRFFLYHLIPPLSLLSVCFHYQPPPADSLSLLSSLFSGFLKKMFYTLTNSTPLVPHRPPPGTCMMYSIKPSAGPICWTWHRNLVPGAVLCYTNWSEPPAVYWFAARFDPPVVIITSDAFTAALCEVTGKVSWISRKRKY